MHVHEAIYYWYSAKTDDIVKNTNLLCRRNYADFSFEEHARVPKHIMHKELTIYTARRKVYAADRYIYAIEDMDEYTRNALKNNK